jgi:GT2 family glycosyltransferase
VRPDRASLVTGTLGSPGGPRRRLLARLSDRVLDARLARHAARLDALAAAAPERDVLVASVYRGDGGLLPAALEELGRTRHRARFALGSMGDPAPALAEHTVARGLGGGKYDNVNAILAAATGSDPATGALRADWVLVVDDDVELPERFLDRLLGVAEGHGLALAQPAQSLTSHAAWPVTRRRRGSLLRESRFVEIGPVTLFRRDVLEELTPFPTLRYGWGLDVHWAALAEERGWRRGIVDALPVRHEAAGVAGAYSSEDAIEEALEFLTDRPYLDKEAAQEILRTHPLR